MEFSPRLMVFTDLDGTLIDHDTYRWGAAQPALAALHAVCAGVVLASSKTAAEVAPLRTEIGLQGWPAIVENGAGYLPPQSQSDQATFEIDTNYTALRQALAEVPQGLRDLFRGFGDVSPAELSQITGLPSGAAKLAQQRDFSEPGQWLGDAHQKADFLSLLQEQGVVAQQGGRFLTLSFGGNKVDQMRRILRDYTPQYSIALGDAPNDVQMLEAADFGVVVANPHCAAPLPRLVGEAEGRILRTTDPGPIGWNSAVLHLIDHLKLNEG